MWTYQGIFVKLMLFSIPLLALAIYNLQLLEENSHTGVIAITVDFWFCANYFIWFFIFAALYPSKAHRPTDIFSIFYLPISCICSSVYWKTTGLLDTVDATLLMILLISPIFALRIMRKIPFITIQPNIKIQKPFPEKVLPRILLLILVVAAIYGFILNGSVGGFDLSSSYDRRLIARDTFADNIFIRYLFDNAMNGVLPLLAFVAGRDKSLIYSVFAIAFALLNFWLIGTKAAFLYVTLMFLLGKACAAKKQENLPFYFLMAVFFLFVSALVEYHIAGRSLIADYIIRRAFMVGAQIQTYYFDSIFNGKNFPGTLITGLQIDSLPTFFIGETYFGNPLTNANTNAFLYATALAGLPDLLLCVAFIGIFFRMLDKNYAKTESKNAIAIASLYTILLLEQAFTVAFISSGIFLCFLLVSATRTQKT